MEGGNPEASGECLPPESFSSLTARPRAQHTITLNRREFTRAHRRLRASEPEEEETAPNLEPQSESDQGCEPTTAAAEGILVVLDTEDWLIDLDMEVMPPTLNGLSLHHYRWLKSAL